MITHALAGKPLPVYGDGQQVRDWLYVGDHCSAIRDRPRTAEASAKPTTSAAATSAATSRSSKPSAPCSTSSPSLVPLPPRQLIRFVQDRPGHDRRYAIDARKIESELGWHAAGKLRNRPPQNQSSGTSPTRWIENVTSGAYQQWVATNYGSRAAHTEAQAGPQ